MRGNGVVVEYRLCRVHQLLPAFDVARVTDERMNHPELCQGQPDRLVLPSYRHTVDIQLQITARNATFRALRFLHRLEAPKQRGDSRHQMGQADVLCQVVVGPQTQP